MFHVFFLVILLCVCVLVVASSILPPKIGHLLQRTNVIVDDELKYYKLGMDKYRDRIHRKTADSLRDFSLKQRESFINIKKQMVLGIKAYKEICDHADKRMKENQLKLKALNQKFKQRDLFDDSLDSFRAFYSHGGVSGGQNNIRRWASIQTARCRRSIESAMRLVGMRGQTNRNENVDRLLNELKSFHNTMQQRVAVLNSTIHAAFPAAVCKEDVRRAREAVDAQLHRLEQEGALWLDSTRRQVDSSVRALQARLQQRTRVLATLESEVRQKAVAVEYSTLNDQALHQVLQMIDPKSEGWRLVRQEGGISVYRRHMQGDSDQGSRYACVKCHGEVRAAPDKVFELLTDETRTKEFNSLYDKGRTVAHIDDGTKVVHSASITIFPFKPRDFVTVVHFRQLRDGTRLVLNRATEHELVPKKVPGYIRGTIVLAANIIQPIPGKPDWSRVTMITQVDPGGFAPASIMNQVCALGPVGFIKSVESAANKCAAPTQAESTLK